MQKLFKPITILILIGLNLQLAMAEQQEDGFVWITELNYKTVRGFTEGLAPVYNGDAWGFVNNKGEEVIHAVYTEVKPFKDGLAIVMFNAKYGVIDQVGKVVFPFKFDKIEDFNSGFALAELEQKQVYIKPDGSIIDLAKRYTYSSYSDGMAQVRNKKKVGFINEKGKLIIDLKFHDASPFSEGVALVSRSKDSESFINKKGKTEIDYTAFRGMEPQYIEGMAKYSRMGKWGFVSKNKVIIPASYEQVGNISEGYVPVKSNSIWGFLGFSKPSIAPRFSDVLPFSGGVACIKTINNYGYIDINGKEVIPEIFEFATSMENNYAVVSYKGRKGIIKVKDYTDDLSAIASTNVTIKDLNNDGYVEGGESFNIDFTVKNVGGKDIKDLNVELELPFEYQHQFTFEKSFNIGDIPVGESKNVSLKLESSEHLQGDNLMANMTLHASNLFNDQSVEASFQTIGKGKAEVILCDYWFHNDFYDEIKVGDSVTFQATIKNVGREIATDITLHTAWPAYLKRNPKAKYTQKKLLPDESCKVITSFVIDTTCKKEEVAIFSQLSAGSEEPKIKYLKMNLGSINEYVNLMLPSVEQKQTITGETLAISTTATPAIETEKSTDELLQILDKTNQSMIKSQKFALVIGNENYAQQSVTYESDVDFAKNDAKAFAEYAKKIMGVPESNVVLLQNATAAKMKQNIDKLIKVANNYGGNAELLIFYAGHGQHDTESKETYLIPVDVSLTEPTSGISLAGLYEQLGHSEAKKVNVFLDACYSGVGRGIVIEVKESRVPGNMLVMTATSATQKSMPYQEKEHGLFTYYLLKTLGENNGDVDLGTLYRNVEQEVKRNSIWLNNSEQSPALIKGDKLDNSWASWSLKR